MTVPPASRDSAARPTTEAGQRLLASMLETAGLLGTPFAEGTSFAKTILAIEREARADALDVALRKVRAILVKQGYPELVALFVDPDARLATPSSDEAEPPFVGFDPGHLSGDRSVEIPVGRADTTGEPE